MSHLHLCLIIPNIDIYIYVGTFIFNSYVYLYVYLCIHTYILYDSTRLVMKEQVEQQHAPVRNNSSSCQQRRLILFLLSTCTVKLNSASLSQTAASEKAALRDQFVS